MGDLIEVRLQETAYADEGVVGTASLAFKGSGWPDVVMHEGQAFVFSDCEGDHRSSDRILVFKRAKVVNTEARIP